MDNLLDMMWIIIHKLLNTDANYHIVMKIIYLQRNTKVSTAIKKRSRYYIYFDYFSIKQTRYWFSSSSFNH